MQKRVEVMIQIEKMVHKYVIKNFECDCKDKLRLRTLLNMLQDIADDSANDIGIGYEHLRTVGKAWVLMDDRIKELNFGDWEMMMYDEIDDPNIKNWHTHFVDTPIPGGESFRDIYNRVSSFLDSLKESGAKNVLIFAHGGVLACAQVYAGHTKLKNIFDGLIPFGGMIEINV
jgi:broad specificity phosphatase PhoE